MGRIVGLIPVMILEMTIPMGAAIQVVDLILAVGVAVQAAMAQIVDPQMEDLLIVGRAGVVEAVAPREVQVAAHSNVM